VRRQLARYAPLDVMRLLRQFGLPFARAGLFGLPPPTDRQRQPKRPYQQRPGNWAKAILHRSPP